MLYTSITSVLHNIRITTERTAFQAVKTLLFQTEVNFNFMVISFLLSFSQIMHD